MNPQAATNSRDGNPGQTPALLQIDHPCGWQRRAVLAMIGFAGGLLILWIFSFFVVFGWIGAAWPPQQRTLATVGIPVMVIVGASAIRTLRLQSRARRAARTSGVNPAERAIATLAALHEGSPSQAAADIVRGIHGDGVRGCSLVIRPANESLDIVALDVPIEPLPLLETDENFRQLAGASAPAAGNRKSLHDARAYADPNSTETSAPQNAADQRSVARLRRALRLGGTWMSLLFGYSFVFAAIRTWNTGVVTWKLPVFGALLLASLIGPGWLSAHRSGFVLLVTGGLIQRKATRSGAGYQIHLFRRTESVLLVYRYTRWQWGWAVCDGASTASLIGTRDEAIMLLRAWLSPLPPPDVTRMDDLK